MANEKPEPKQLKTLDLDRQVGTIRFSPCGKWLFAGGFDASIRRWDFSGDEPRELTPLAGHHGWVDRIGFAPQGKWLFSADSWGELRAWAYAEDTPQPKWQVPEAHDGWIRDLAVSDDGRLLATGGRDCKVRVWSAEDGKQLHQFEDHTDEVFAVGIHPDGKSVVSGDLMGNIKHWDLASGRCTRDLRMEAMHFYDRIQDVAGIRILRFHDGGNTLICAGSEPTKAGRSYGIPTIHLIDWESLKPQRSLQQGADKDGYIYDLAWHKSGFFALVTSGTPGSGMLALRRIDEEEPFYINTKVLNTHSLAVHPDGRRLVVASINSRNQGNGAVLDKEGKYLGNFSPLHVFELPEQVAG